MNVLSKFMDSHTTTTKKEEKNFVNNFVRISKDVKFNRLSFKRFKLF